MMELDTTATASSTIPSSSSIEQQTLEILNADFSSDYELSAIPTLCDLAEHGLSTLSHGGQRALSRAVDDLETLHKSNTTSQTNMLILELVLETTTITKLTSLVTTEHHQTSADALERLQVLGSAIPRRVCQFPFKRNDIVWVCRTCQADETCVLCHQCYKQSYHEGHDVAFYHAQAGGCCDCGDPDAWDPNGFCPHHGCVVIDSGDKAAAQQPNCSANVKIMVQTLAKWLVEVICTQTHKQHLRTKVSATTTATTTAEQESSSSDAASSTTTTAAAATTATTTHHELTFNSQAASTSKSRGDNPAFASEPNRALELGHLARQGHGLYLVLHADDVHTKQQIAQSLRHLLGTTYFNDAILNKLVSSLQTHGQLVVWGTMELMADLTAPQRLLWMDSDQVATRAVGANMLERASRLTGLISSICTRDELLKEQRAVAVLEWLTALARSCDPLCQTVAESILPEPHLIPMLRADFSLASRVTKAWHSLLLTLLAVPTFKSHLAAAYCDTYRHVTAEYARGMGVLERSSYTLSVQFLNRVTYVVDLVQHRDLLGKLGKALYETLAVALVGRRLNPNHYCLTHRRYSPCVSDLKCVLNVKGMARLFSSKNGTFLQDWLASLSLAQWMDAQAWRTFGQGHVETEPRGWVGAFNASISLGSLFERLLGWDDDDASPAPDSPLSAQVPTVVELTQYCLLEGLLTWQRDEMAQYKATSNTAALELYSKAPAALPYPTTHMGEALALKALPISHLAPWSFHLPLHRFVAACLREVCRRPVEQGMAKLLNELHHDELFYGLLEFPLVVLSRAAQVRAGLWKRNGSLMFDQVLNYAEPPFCRALRDADVLLVQFATLGRGTGCLLTLLLHRFGIFDFMGFAKAPHANPDLYKEQVEANMYPGEQRAEEDDENVVAMPWTFTPAKDVTASLALLEEFLHLLIVVISELPPIPPTDKADHTVQAKRRLRREVIHRLASGPKTHSELSEVHHVLSNWDNVFLSEEGKLVNPDDATGAALGAALIEVAEHKSVRGKLEPNQWVLCDAAWEDYDPAFYHISLRHHQSATESRPRGKTEGDYGMEPKSYAPPPPEPHPSFMRLRRDVTSDATVLAIIYRTLHVHCRDLSNKSDLTGLRAQAAYQGDSNMSETALARAVHLLTLGAFSWETATAVQDWRQHGGSYEGSVFYKNSSPPTASDWIARALLANPAQVMDCDWYEGEETTLLLLKRLAMDGGSKSVGFVAQDQAVRAGAAWLCEFACKYNTEASNLLGAAEKATEPADTGETELDRKKREAKARAMERMNAQAARFAAMMQIDTEDSEEEKEPIESTRRDPLISASQEEEDEEGRRSSSASLVGSDASFNSFASISSTDKSQVRTPPHRYDPKDSNDNGIPPRLLKCRPVCIICNEDSTTASRDPEPRPDDEGSGNRKRSRRKTDRSNALAFVGYAQPSAVLKGGGGTPPTSDNHSALSSVRRFAGVHTALCGHAVHSECCESYLATVLHRDDRIIGRREEFKCPLCQRLSNCLVPFIDVGVDWVDPPLKNDERDNEEFMKRDNKEFMGVCMDLDENACDDSGMPEESTKLSLHRFLNTTPWWVGRDDMSVVWDGQSAFVAAPPTTREDIGDTDVSTDSSQPKPRRRSVRSLRKKDLYAAWSAMMRTPRFIRRRQVTRSPSAMEGSGMSDTSLSTSVSQMSALEDTSMGETLVWRRFMDLLSDMANRADAKRLGEQHFLQYCGEFRHYYAEKHAHNTINRLTGRESADWPACISSVPLTDNRRQELSREKLLSKLLTSIQAFTYSCCSEAFEVKRLMKKEKDSGDGSIQTLYSKFGIAGLACNDNLIIMPVPHADQEEGTQPFDGRLGKLRYLGLAVMAAAGAVSADLVQLVLSLPLSREGVESMSPPPRQGDPTNRAPVVFPVLFGHVLTHVVAAMCATSGRARARSDSLEIVWSMPFTKRGSFYGMTKEPAAKNVDGVMKDCKGFIKLGLLARILQVLLSKMQIDPGSAAVGRRVLVMKCIRQALIDQPLSVANSQSADQWLRGCASLLEASLSQDVSMVVVASAAYGADVMNRFKEACQMAADAATSFLCEVGTIYQILIPGVTLRQDTKRSGVTEVREYRSLGSLYSLISDLGLEPIDEMLKSTLVRHVVANWFRQACDHTCKSETSPNDVSRGMVQKRLFQTEGFRVYDWPMESCRAKDNDEDSDKKMSALATPTAAEPQDESSPMELDSYPIIPARVELRSSTSGPLVAFSSRKSVHLLGGYAEDRNMPMITSPRPRIHMLPTSYTDLYAELGVLCPDSEQTALCLICGEVLNANGKGECTKHAAKCGAGACMFFLLQECQGLIMHSNKAVYVQSPYVDSHGETPQYRGRPLNLDLDRYEIFRELWTGHGIRQKVVQERGSARQVIIADFY